VAKIGSQSVTLAGPAGALGACGIAAHLVRAGDMKVAR